MVWIRKSCNLLVHVSSRIFPVLYARSGVFKKALLTTIKNGNFIGNDGRITSLYLRSTASLGPFLKIVVWYLASTDLTLTHLVSENVPPSDKILCPEQAPPSGPPPLLGTVLHVHECVNLPAHAHVAEHVSDYLHPCIRMCLMYLHINVDPQRDAPECVPLCSCPSACYFLCARSRVGEYLCMCIFLFMFMCLCMCTCLYMFLRTLICICMFSCMRMFLCTFIFLCLCTYMCSWKW